MKDGGPAFPSHGSMGEVAQQGMSLRDYFAAAALQAITAKHPVLQEVDTGTLETVAERHARGAYIYADAMLAEREK